MQKNNNIIVNLDDTTIKLLQWLQIEKDGELNSIRFSVLKNLNMDIIEQHISKYMQIYKSYMYTIDRVLTINNLNIKFNRIKINFVENQMEILS